MYNTTCFKGCCPNSFTHAGRRHFGSRLDTTVLDFVSDACFPSRHHSLSGGPVENKLSCLTINETGFYLGVTCVETDGRVQNIDASILARLMVSPEDIRNSFLFSEFHSSDD